MEDAGMADEAKKDKAKEDEAKVDEANEDEAMENRVMSSDVDLAEAKPRLIFKFCLSGQWHTDQYIRGVLGEDTEWHERVAKHRLQYPFELIVRGLERVSELGTCFADEAGHDLETHFDEAWYFVNHTATRCGLTGAFGVRASEYSIPPTNPERLLLSARRIPAPMRTWLMMMGQLLAEVPEHEVPQIVSDVPDEDGA